MILNEKNHIPRLQHDTRGASYLKSNNKAKSDGQEFPVKQCEFAIVVSEFFVSRRTTAENTGHTSAWQTSKLQSLRSRNIQSGQTPGEMNQPMKSLTKPNRSNHWQESYFDDVYMK